MEVISQVTYDDQPEMSLPSLAESVQSVLLEKYDLSVPEECIGFIVRCLHVKDYNVENAAKLVKHVSKSMEALQDMLDKFQPKLYKSQYLDGTLTVLKSRDEYGRQVLLSRLGKWDTKIFDFDDATSAAMLLFGYVVGQSAETQRKGVVFIYDLSGYGVRHVKAMRPTRLVQLVKMMQDGAPGKIKGIHLVFHPRVFSTIYQIVKPFLKDKITKRVHFHGDDVSTLHKFLKPEILPGYLGGSTVDDSTVYDLDLMNKLIRQDAQKDINTYGIPTS